MASQYTITLPDGTPDHDLATVARQALTTLPGGAIDDATAALTDYEAIARWTVTRLWIPGLRDSIRQAKLVEADTLADTTVAPLAGVTIAPVP